MTISACIIAKTPDVDLARCVASLKGRADEIVVVCDPDKASAFRRFLGRPRRYRVLPLEWCDDFSAVRNAALEAATGEWLFWIDTDEVLDGNLRALCELIPDGIDGAWVSQMSYADHDRNIGMVARQWRVARNGIGAHFEGRVHEQLVLPGRPPVMATQDGVTVFHYGYLPEYMAGKRLRALKIYRQEVEERPEDAHAHFNLGVEFSAGEDYHEALEPFRTAIRLWEAAPRPLPWIPALFTSAIFAAVKAGELQEAIRIAAQAPKEAFTPDYFYYTAMASWDSGFKPDALGLLERGMVALPDPHFHEASIPGRIREALAALSAE